MSTFQLFAFILTSILASSCIGQQRVNSQDEPKPITDKYELLHDYGAGDVNKCGFLDSSGTIWFGTTKEGVYKYDGTRFINISMKDGLCSNEVNAITQDTEGIMWFGTAKGLCSYDGGTFTNIPLPKEDIPNVSPTTGLPSRKTETILSLILDRNGDFWIGTDAGGAYRYDGNSFIPYLKFEGRIQPDGNVYNNCIPNIIEDKNGHIWIGSFTHGGLTEIDGDMMIHHALKDEYGDGMISTSYMDDSGNLWFGTRNGGIYTYDYKSFKNISDKKTGNQIAMASVIEGAEGIYWIGSFARKGVYQYKEEKEEIIPLDIKGSDQLLSFISCKSKLLIMISLDLSSIDSPLRASL